MCKPDIVNNVLSILGRSQQGEYVNEELCLNCHFDLNVSRADTNEWSSILTVYLLFIEK